MDLVQFAFDVYEHEKRNQRESSADPTDFMKSMLVVDYVSALFKGAVAAVGNSQDDRQSIAALLKILDDFLALWVKNCGLDFTGIFRSGRDVPDEKKPPLSLCWCLKQESGQPVVYFLLKLGYRPCSW
jgi:hypothetical protein